MSNAMMIQMHGVTKRFGRFLALSGIDLQLQQGHCLGILGPNGAGKTTLLKILGTMLRPSTGTVSIAGYDAIQEPEKIRPFLGVLSHRTFLYGHLTGLENLQFYGRLFGVPKLVERIYEVLNDVALEAHARQLVRTYSRGMQQRLAIARTLLHQPRLLLLDEPYTGLDRRATSLLQKLLQHALSQRCTIVLSTHDFPRLFELCHEVAIQCQGKIVSRRTMVGLDLHALEQLYLTHVDS
jgi:heme exporter protein A